jgi:hypothetical protein
MRFVSSDPTFASAASLPSRGSIAISKSEMEAQGRLCSLGWQHAEDDLGAGAGDRFISLLHASAELPEANEQP